MDPGQNPLVSKKGDINGSWVSIRVADDVTMPQREHKEATVSVAFAEDRVSLGPLNWGEIRFHREEF